jgi:hypothetical protein
MDVKPACIVLKNSTLTLVVSVFNLELTSLACGNRKDMTKNEERVSNIVQ